jgi:hypothetical protein
MSDTLGVLPQAAVNVAEAIDHRWSPGATCQVPELVGVGVAVSPVAVSPVAVSPGAVSPGARAEDAGLAGASLTAGSVAVGAATATEDGPDPDDAGIVTGVVAAGLGGAVGSGVWPARDAGTVVGTGPGWLLAGGITPAAPRALPAGAVAGVGDSVGGINDMVGAVVRVLVGVDWVVAVGAVGAVDAGAVPVGAAGVDTAGVLVDGSATETGDEDADDVPALAAPPSGGGPEGTTPGPTRIMVGAKVPPTVAARLGVALTRGPDIAARPTVQATIHRVPGSEIRTRK